MTKRFSLTLEDTLFEAFYKAFPHHGCRQVLLRTCVRLLLKHGTPASNEFREELVKKTEKVKENFT